MSPPNKYEKRERGRNFTETEKESLIKICLKYRDILQNKKTDAISIAIKNHAWEKITKEYNSKQITGARDTKNLKILYDNLRIKQRKSKDKPGKNDDASKLFSTTYEENNCNSNNSSSKISSCNYNENFVDEPFRKFSQDEPDLKVSIVSVPSTTSTPKNENTEKGPSTSSTSLNNVDLTEILTAGFKERLQQIFSNSYEKRQCLEENFPFSSPNLDAINDTSNIQMHPRSQSESSSINNSEYINKKRKQKSSRTKRKLFKMFGIASEAYLRKQASSELKIRNLKEEHQKRMLLLHLEHKILELRMENELRKRKLIDLQLGKLH